LIQKLDGVTQGPNELSGVIGKALITCEDQPVMQFSSIQLESCPCLDDIELSTDWQYRPGPVIPLRWLTTAN